jgi:hypothetical protein
MVTARFVDAEPDGCVELVNVAGGVGAVASTITLNAGTFASPQTPAPLRARTWKKNVPSEGAVSDVDVPVPSPAVSGVDSGFTKATLRE